MRLPDAIAAAGMTPPREIVPGRWIRFPGIGKSRSNRAGWCRLLTPTLAVFGDWSSGLVSTWKDDTHQDDATTQRLLIEARDREQNFQRDQRARQRRAADEAIALIERAQIAPHPYLRAKGFPDFPGLVVDDQLLIPMRDARDYRRVVGVQKIAPDGTKRFLGGTRATLAIHRLGIEAARARAVWLCEGYATGLTCLEALKRLQGLVAVIVCFSAGNLVEVATLFPRACVAADNDESKAGERAARETGLPWTMPRTVGFDFNDLYCSEGILAVVQALRSTQKEAA